MKEPPGELHGLVYGPNGHTRLCLLYERLEVGWDFSCIKWQEQRGLEWIDRLTISRDTFQGTHDKRRWVSELHSLDPQRGWAVLQIAEGDKPFRSCVATNFYYSWRTWDLTNNREIERLKDCESPFDPLD